MSDPNVVERTFAFVDLAGFTALTEAHGDAEAFATVRTFRERAVTSIGTDDHLVKTIGDALMFAFPDPDTAVTALCRLIDEELLDPERNLLPRAGAHHGTAIANDGDYVGAAVNLASRVTGIARGGQVVTTARVASAAKAQHRTVFHLGPTLLRNIAEPVDLWEIQLGAASRESAVDPVCAMRVVTEGPNAVSLAWNDTHVWFCSLQCVSRFAASPDSFTARLTGE